MNFEIYINDKIWAHKHNCVTNVGRDLIRLNLTTGGTARQLAWIHLGRVNQLIENPTADHLDYDTYQVRPDAINRVDGGLDFIYTMPEATNVGQQYNAAGIFTGQDPSSFMYAMAYFPLFTKTNDKFISVKWKLRWRSAWS